MINLIREMGNGGFFGSKKEVNRKVERKRVKSDLVRGLEGSLRRYNRGKFRRRKRDKIRRKS